MNKGYLYMCKGPKDGKYEFVKRLKADVPYDSSFAGQTIEEIAERLQDMHGYPFFDSETFKWMVKRGHVSNVEKSGAVIEDGNSRALFGNDTRYQVIEVVGKGLAEFVMAVVHDMGEREEDAPVNLETLAESALSVVTNLDFWRALLS